MIPGLECRRCCFRASNSVAREHFRGRGENKKNSRAMELLDKVHRKACRLFGQAAQVQSREQVPLLAHTPVRGEGANYSGQGAVYFHSLFRITISLQTLSPERGELKLKAFCLPLSTESDHGGWRGVLCLFFPGSAMDRRAVYTAVWWCPLIFYVSGSSELCALKYQQKTKFKF